MRILQSRICSEVGRTCPCNHGVFPSFNLVGKIVRFQPSVFLLSCKRILFDKVGGCTQGQGAWTNLSARWRHRRRRVPINYLTVGNCMVCHPPSRGTHGGSASLGGFSICRPTVQFRSRLRFVQSSNVVYPALPSFFVISEIPWGRFREGNRANSSG